MNNHIPPLRQSLFEQMACPHSYGLIYIEGLKVPDSVASNRGTEVHRVLAQYVAHCAHRRVVADFDYLDTLIKNVGQETAEILETCRDSFKVDYDNLFACEVSMGVDGKWQPTYSVDHDDRPVAIDLIWGYDASGEPPAYCAILDTIYLMPGGKLAKIKDYKSHPRPFDPDTMQGKLYALLLFLHLPDLEEVEFVLNFVRYGNVNRPIKYLRSDVPELKADVERARNRQKDMHTFYSQDALPALAGTHCTYCPALVNFSCPLGKLNPHLALTPEERFNFRLWYDAQNRANNAAMAEYVDSTGLSIHATDNNGNAYYFGPSPKQKTTFPLFTFSPEEGLQQSALLDKILDWCLTDAPEDGRPTKRMPVPWPAKLRISNTKLMQFLRANKRADLHQWTMDTVAETETVVELRVSRDAVVDDGAGEEHHEYSEEFQR